jgi:signal transduction histidine kinase
MNGNRDKRPEFTDLVQTSRGLNIVQNEEHQLRTESGEPQVVSLAALSHELRTPLTSILGYVELLLSGAVDPLTTKQREYLQAIERNAKRLARATVEIEFLARGDNEEQANSAK